MHPKFFTKTAGRLCFLPGPVGDLDKGLALLDGEPIDAAVLDVNLEGAKSFPIAEVLSGRGVPYLFVTGYDGWALPDVYRDVPRIAKPFATAAVLSAVGQVLTRRCRREPALSFSRRTRSCDTPHGGAHPLDAPALTALEEALAETVALPVRREILTEGRPISGERIIVSGWAARVRILSDGRRQFLSFLLPGDLIGHCHQPQPLAVSTVVTLTPVEICPAPPVDDLPTLCHAYAISGAIEEANLLSQITRLGRLTALERCADLLLELHERLALAGLVAASGFDFPLTQETFADMLGLTPVHVNRMIQLLRRSGDILWESRRLKPTRPEDLARAIGRVPVRVRAE